MRKLNPIITMRKISIQCCLVVSLLFSGLFSYSQESPHFQSADISGIPPTSIDMSQTLTITVNNMKDQFGNFYTPNTLLVIFHSTSLNTPDVILNFTNPQENLQITHTFNLPGDYIIEFSFDNSGIYTTRNLYVTYMPSFFAADISMLNDHILVNNSMTLNISNIRDQFNNPYSPSEVKVAIDDGSGISYNLDITKPLPFTFTYSFGIPGSYPIKVYIDNILGYSHTLTVIVPLTPAVSISPTVYGPVCTGTSVTFIATPVNGGTEPAYQWKLNGLNVGTNSSTYSNALLTNGDAVTCVLTANNPYQPTATATSNTVVITVNPTTDEPAGNTTQSFCNSATVANLVATGTSIQWYDVASGGTALPGSTAVINGNHYYASQTLNGCEGATRLDILAIINTPAAPTGASLQTICNAGTLADLTVTGSSIKWYDASVGGTALPATTALANGTIYYATQTLNYCESSIRLSVQVTINNRSTSSETKVACDSYTWHGIVYTTSGDKTFESLNAQGCTNTATLHLTINNKAIISIPDVWAVKPGGAANTIYIGYGPASVTLSAQVSGGKTPYNYKWHLGSPTGSVTGTNSNTLVVNPTTSSIYYLIVTDFNGCVTTIAKTINVTDIRCGSKLEKVTVCVNSKGKYTTNCIASSAVSSNIANGSYLGACNTPLITSDARTNTGIEVSSKNIQPELNNFDVTVSPNPSSTDFKLIVQSNSSKTISIRLFDISGRVISTINKIQRNETVTVGSSLTGGTYIAEVSQGSNSKIVKLIKIN